MSPAAPRIPTLRLPELDDADLDDLLGSDEHESTRFTGLDIGGRNLAGAHFIECELTGLGADDTILRGARCISTRISDLSATVLKAARCTLREVEVLSSRLGVIEMYESAWQSVLFDSCKVEWLNLRGSKIDDVTFRGCHFGDLDMSSTRTRRLRFEGCTVGTLTVDGARLEDVDLRDAEIGTVSNLEGLRGTTLTEAQVLGLLPAFAGHFGFSIEE